MKVSLNWLQKYIGAPLPKTEEVLDAFTFHAFEIEEAQGDLVDVKILPNRAADCLSHRGIARELAAVLGLPVKDDPLRAPLPEFPKTDALKVEIEDPKKCLRYMGAIVRGVKVGPSPDWLKEALESVGQRSINNVVDATNYVMLSLGQPLHAFDLGKMDDCIEKGHYGIGVQDGEGHEITTLSGETYHLSKGTLLIVDNNCGEPLGIAGIKGGKAAEVTADTTDLIVESANFDGTTVRRGAQALRLFTDASLRFQNRPSPELAAYGMRDVLALITEIADGTVEGVVDVYPQKSEINPVSVSLTRINGLLGANFSKDDVVNVFRRLGLETRVEDETFTVTPPFERTDLNIPEDLVEEVGRIMGYDKISGAELPPITGEPDQDRYRGIERMKDQLVEQGFIEVSTQSFAKKGDIALANPLDKSKPMLRTSLEQNLQEALKKAKEYAPLVLPPKAKPKLFEVGTVFPKEGEYLELRMTETVPAWGENFPTHDNLSVAKLEDYGKGYEPKRYALGAYKPYSAYPFITRDIALWVPSGTEAGEIEKLIRENATELLMRLDQFDRFEKDSRVSYAYRLVFQSFERTLTDEAVNGFMEKIYAALREKGYEIR